MADTEQAVATAATDVKKDAQNAGHSILKRLVLWVEKEAHLLGLNVETEVASILAKLHLKK